MLRSQAIDLSSTAGWPAIRTVLLDIYKGINDALRQRVSGLRCRRGGRLILLFFVGDKAWAQNPDHVRAQLERDLVGLLASFCEKGGAAKGQSGYTIAWTKTSMGSISSLCC